MAAPKSDPFGPVSKTVLALLVATIPTALLFAPTVGYPLLSLDDAHAVVGNPGIRDLSLAGLRHLFFEDAQEMRYFPLTYVSFAIDYRFWELDPFGYHLTNVLLHVANTALVFGVLLALTRDRIAAMVAALLFGIHPLQVESVAWVTSRKNVLFLFFFLLSVAAYLRHVRNQGEPDGRIGAWMMLSAGLYVASCLAKTTAITLPAALVLIDYWRNPVGPSGFLAFLRNSVSDKLPYIVGALLVVAASIQFSPPNPFAAEYAFTALEWTGIVGHNLFFYIAKTLVPIHLGVFYPLPAPGELPAHFWAFSVLSVAVIAVAIWALSTGRRVLCFGLSWYFATILPLTLYAVWFSDIPILAADRYHYQSLIGLVLLVGVGTSSFWSKRPALRLPLALALCASFGALFLTAANYRNAWANTVTLFETLLEHHPSDEFYYRLAREHMSLGHEEEAFRAARQAKLAKHQIFFLDMCSHQLDLSNIHRRMGDYTEAARFAERAIASTPNLFEPVDARSPFAYLVLADLLEKAGDGAAAARARAKVAGARVDPKHYFASTWLVVAPEASRSVLEARRAIDERDGLPWFYLGILSKMSGDDERSKAQLTRAYELGFPPQQAESTAGRAGT